MVHITLTACQDSWSNAELVRILTTNQPLLRAEDSC